MNHHNSFGHSVERSPWICPDCLRRQPSFDAAVACQRHHKTPVTPEERRALRRVDAGKEA